MTASSSAILTQVALLCTCFLFDLGLDYWGITELKCHFSSNQENMTSLTSQLLSGSSLFIPYPLTSPAITLPAPCVTVIRSEDLIRVRLKHQLSTPQKSLSSTTRGHFTCLMLFLFMFNNIIDGPNRMSLRGGHEK